MKTLFTITAVVTVALFAILIALPHKELDWDRSFLSMVKNYSEVDSDENPLDGYTVLITGATSGIGLALATELSRFGAKVIAVGRSERKLSMLNEEYPNIYTLKADFSQLKAVSQAADEAMKRFDKIDILINNAGIHGGFDLLGQHPTVDGYDPVFAVNYLSHFLLTEKLSTLIAKSKKPMVVQMSSSYHWAVDGSDLNPLYGKGHPIASQPGGSHGFFFFRTQRSYANSKLAQIYHARALKRKHPELSKAKIVNVCPAWVSTSMTTGNLGFVRKMMNQIAYMAPGWGLASTMKAMFQDDDDTNDFYYNSRVFEVFGKLFSQMPSWTYTIGLRDVVSCILALGSLLTQKLAPDAFPGKSSPESYRQDVADALYNWSYDAVAQFLIT